MNRVINALLFAVLVALLLLPAVVFSQDARYAGPPAREADGSIKRSRAVLREFKRTYPCPSTGKSTGSCPGWHLDHVLPLVCGGADVIINLQWLPVEVKTCAGTTCKDRWERRVYCRYVPPTPTKGTP